MKREFIIVVSTSESETGVPDGPMSELGSGEDTPPRSVFASLHSLAADLPELITELETKLRADLWLSLMTRCDA